MIDLNKIQFVDDDYIERAGKAKRVSKLDPYLRRVLETGKPLSYPYSFNEKTGYDNRVTVSTKIQKEARELGCKLVTSLSADRTEFFVERKTI